MNPYVEEALQTRLEEIKIQLEGVSFQFLQSKATVERLAEQITTLTAATGALKAALGDD